MTNPKRALGISLLLALLSPLGAFYLPLVNLGTPQGSFYSGYTTGLGGYMGTTLFFSRLFPNTDVSLGFISTMPTKKNLRPLNLGVLGISSSFSLGGGTIELHLLYGRSFSDGFMSGRNWPLRF